MALGEKRNGSVFATAAQRRDAAEYQVTLEPEVVPVVVDDTPQRTLNTDIGTLGRAHNLFFTPSAEGRDFNSVLQEVQEYISGAYAALITGGGEDSKEQLMRYITKYLQDRRIAVAGMTQTELVDAIYSEMAEFGFLTRYIYADGIEEININSWRDIEVQYSDGRSEKLTEHFDSPEHALAVIRRMLHASGMVLDNASPLVTGHLTRNTRILFCDELGTMPPFDILPLFSAGRSRRLTLVPIIQSLAQLEKNYGKEGASILMDNCQDVICGGFAPNSEAADAFSKALGSRTVLSGSVSRGKNDPSQSLQMMERPLLTADELKSIPKGSFIVQKTGCHPMRTRLRLFLEWGITFEEEYRVEEQAARKVFYADRDALIRAIVRKYPPKLPEQKTTRSVKGEGQLHDAPVQEMVVAEDIDYDRMPHKRTPYNLPRQEVDR